MLNHILQGKVVKGEAVGRTIGFPTANLKLPKTPKIKHGVYAALVTLAGKNFLGLAYFGPRYIFGQKQDNFEVFILNFKSNIYGKKLKVKLIKFLRGPRRVTKLTALVKLLQSDTDRLNDFVVLVDKHDQPIGIEHRDKAHRGKGQLHRAFSVYLFNQKRQLLLQQRSKRKQLWPLYWANSCCSHPRPGENYLEAAQRRLKEELGIRTHLKPVGNFLYRASDARRGSEYEQDMVLVGVSGARPRPNKKEVAAWQYTDPKKLPRPLAPWVKLGLKTINLSDIFKS